MTPISGALPLFYFPFFALIGCVVGLSWPDLDADGMVRRDAPRIELVARSGIMEAPKLARRGNVSVEYLRYATQ